MIDLVTGGAASGKSDYAEQKAVRLAKLGQKQLVYLATMHVDASPETAARIARHRALRSGRGFETVEQESHLEQLQRQNAVILLEDLSNLLANEMFREDRSADAILPSLLKLGEQNELVIVTNELTSDGNCYDSFTERFRSQLMELHRAIAAHPLCRSVTEVVVGIPVVLK